LISLNNLSAKPAILTPMKMPIDRDRLLRRALVVIAIGGLAIGGAARVADYGSLANQFWFAATVPVIAGLGYSIVRDLAAGRMGVDAIALVSMLGALGLGQPLAGAVIALMYSGGNVLEDFAVGRAERDLRALVDRAPRVARRRLDHRIEDVPVAQIAVGDSVLVRAGEVVPVDGILAGETFEMMASAVAGESTYAGIVRLVTAAQTARAPFVRLADRFAVILLPVTIVLAAAAWLMSGDLVRSLAVFVAATPCPLILPHRSPSLPASRKPRGAASWSRATRRSRRWRTHTPYCSTRPAH
jgi:cation transport ATPase